MRIVNEFRAVVTHNGHRISDARKNAFSSAGKSCKEMRLNEAFCNEQGSVHGCLIQNAVRAGRKNADLNIRGRIMRIMNDDAVLKLFIKFISKLSSKLFNGCWSVETCGYKQSDLDLRVSFSQFTDHVRKDILTRDRSCMVADDDHAVRFSFCQFTQSRAVDRMLHGFPYNVNAIAFTCKLINA